MTAPPTAPICTGTTRGAGTEAASAARNLITDYLEDHSRITDEGPCLHVEWRARGVEAMRAAGIARPRDVLRFDHRAFWKERLRLVKVDPGRLGRLFRNREQGTRQHRITDADISLGRKIMCRYQTMQEMLDGLGPLRIGHVLTPLSAEPFLPVTPYMLSLTNRNYDNSDRRDETSSSVDCDSNGDGRQTDVMRRNEGRRRTRPLSLYNKAFHRTSEASERKANDVEQN